MNTKPKRELDFPEGTPFLNHEMEVTVYYEDTDFTGFVFHANYLSYFSRAREEVLGIEVLRQLFKVGKHFVVRKASLLYHRPASHGDILLIQSRGYETQAAVVTFVHEVFRRSEDGSLQPIVTGLIDIVSVGANGSPIRIPSEIK